MASVDELAQAIWDYHQLNHELSPSDCLLVLGSHDLRMAEHGADLYLEGLAPLIVFSGARASHLPAVEGAGGRPVRAPGSAARRPGLGHPRRT